MALASRTWKGFPNINISVFGVTQPRKLIRNAINTPKVLYRKFSDDVRVTAGGDKPSQLHNRDPACYFFREEVQRCLLEMNMRDSSKVFLPRKEGQKLNKDYELKFLTQDELQKEQAKAHETAKYYLQLPPVLNAREDTVTVLAEDPALQGLEESKLLFTDVSYGVPDRERLIVAREPNGVLRYATRDERHRMLQIYFPAEGRALETPSLFAPENLMALWERSELVFVLDLACVQFEPDDPEYVRITVSTYDYINTNDKFDVLIGTRHYGSIAFYLAFTGEMDKFLKFCISHFRIEDAVAIIRVYYITRPDIENVKQPASPDDIDFVREYVTKYSKEKATLFSALDAFLESHVPTNTEEALSVK